MSRFALPTTGAKNVEMQDGSRYVGRGSLKTGRVIEVDRSDHVKAIGSQEHIQRIADFSGVGVSTVTGTECNKCHHRGWKWQSGPCTRTGCDGTMEEVTE